MTAVEELSGARTVPEQTRARYPDATGYAERDGVRIVLQQAIQDGIGNLVTDFIRVAGTN